MTVLDALAKSKNTVAWKLFTEISPAIGIGKLLDMGFSAIADTDYYPSAALGGFTKGVNAVEMASAYAAIENGGEFREPTCIMKMTDSSGNDIVADGFYQKGTSKYIYDENACKMMITCMEAVMTKGTGVGGKLATMPCAGKTGTTNDSKDLWFVGFTKYYTTSVWVGYDIPRSLAGLAYTATPLGIWKTYMDSINNGLPVAKLDDYKITVAPTKEDTEETDEETKEEQQEEEDKAKEEEEKKLEEEKKAEEEKKNTNTDTKKQDETTIDEGENPEEGTVDEGNPSNDDSDNTGGAEDNNTDNGQTEGATENSDGTAETP